MPAGKLWNDLKARREKLPGYHQEFEITRTFKLAHNDQSSKWQIVVDATGEEWREKAVTGGGNQIRIFGSAGFFLIEEGGEEFVRLKAKAKDRDPVPGPYLPEDADWSKAKERERRACGLSRREDVCALFEVPLRPWSRAEGIRATRMNEGLARVLVDTENGLVISLVTTEAIISPRADYVLNVSYVLKSMRYGQPPERALFQLPSPDLHEVKELSRWNAAKITRKLGGKAAPDLSLVDIEGKPLSLSSFKGKIVLLAVVEKFLKASARFSGRPDDGERNARGIPDRRVAHLYGDRQRRNHFRRRRRRPGIC